MINKKVILAILVSSVLIIMNLFNVCAQQIGALPYIYDSVVPKAQNLDIKNNFMVNSFSGAVVYNYPISVPPGTNGLQPNINLYYNSHSATQRPGILESGWTLSESYIQRDTNYTTDDKFDDEFTLVLEGFPYELIHDKPNIRFHTQVESFMYIQNTSGSDENDNDEYWIIRTGNGKSYRFGYYNFSEILSNQYNYTWRWNLDLINDTYNNTIHYNYRENPFPNDEGTAYLDSIMYNNDSKRKINFYYESSNRPYLRTVYENGNKVTQSRRLREIIINADTGMTKRYFFGYNTLTENATLSFLANITEYGSNNVSSLPSIKFEYAKVEAGWGNLTNWIYPECNNDSINGCFSTIDYADSGIRFADVNGDGLMDIIKANETVNPGAGFSKIWLNNGTGWNYSQMWTENYPGCNTGQSVFCFVKTDYKDFGVRLADINGDGLVDVFKSNIASGGNGFAQAFLNNGTTWILSDLWSNNYPECDINSIVGCIISWANKDDLGVRIVDINGDGLVDILKANQNSEVGPVLTGFSKVWINYGRGWNHSATWSNNYPECNSNGINGCFVSLSHEDEGVRLTDVNGDGLVDIMKANISQIGGTSGPFYGTFKVWLNNGTGWNYSQMWSNSSHGCNSGTMTGCFVTVSKKNTGTRLADLNGDGLVDIFQANTSQNAATYQIIGSTMAWLNNGTGWVLSSKLGSNYPECSNQTTDGCLVTYTNDDQGVRISDVDGDGIADIIKSNTSQIIGSGYPFVGLSKTWTNKVFAPYVLKKIEFSLGGEVSINYMKSTYLDNTGNDNQSDLNFNMWIVSNVTKKNNINGAQNTTSVSIYNFTDGMYDYVGKEFRGFNYAEDKIEDKITNHWFHQDPARKGKEFKTEISDTAGNPYHRIEKIWTSQNNTGYFILELNKELEFLFDGDSTKNKTKETVYDYDVFGNLNFKHSKGNIDNANDEKYEFYDYATNNASWIVNGLKNYTFIASNNLTMLSSALYWYDDADFGGEPIKGDVSAQRDLAGGTANNKVTNFSYNSFGNMVNKTDSNLQRTEFIYGLDDDTNTFVDRGVNTKGFATNYEYDLGSGNLLGDIDANGFVKNYTYDEFSIDEKTILPFDSSSNPTQLYDHEFSNVNDGKIFVKQREESGKTPTLDTYRFYDGLGRLIQTKKEATNDRQITTDTYYDNQGRINATSNPYFTAFSQNRTSPDTMINITRYAYDQLDRIVSITNPDGTTKNIQYNRWNITVTDENGHKKSYEIDAYGNIISVAEYNDTQIYKTTYFYDGADRLISINDTLHNNWSYSYDLLGRKIQETDPDRGSWSYSYDAEGNLISQTDARNKIINITYDQLNRKTKELYQGGSINYTYDIYTNNTLSAINKDKIYLNYTYDNRFRKTSEKFSMDSFDFTFTTAYDAADRIDYQILPDGRVINFSYDNQSKISYIEGIVNSISYNQNDNPLNISYANSLVTNYTYYEGDFRLTEIETAGKQDLDYLYDSVGNVIEINNSANNLNYAMRYDELDRLIWTKISGSTSMSLEFIYDAIGNILNITGSQNTHYYYQNTKPHAASTVVYY